MTTKPAASEADHPTYPEYREEFGLDPARFLYADMDVRPLLAGIDNPDLLRAFQAVEADREDPDRELIADINSRIQAGTQPDADGQAAVATDGGVER
jgi:hypothetical protein